MQNIDIVLDSGNTVLNATTNSKGVFSFSKVPVGIYDLYIKIDGEEIYFEDGLIEINAQGDTINIDLLYDGELISDNDNDGSNDNTPANSGGKKRLIKKVRRTIQQNGFFEQYWWMFIPLGLIVIAVPVIIIVKKRSTAKKSGITSK